MRSVLRFIFLSGMLMLPLMPVHAGVVALPHAARQLAAVERTGRDACLRLAVDVRYELERDRCIAQAGAELVAAIDRLAPLLRGSPFAVEALRVYGHRFNSYLLALQRGRFENRASWRRDVLRQEAELDAARDELARRLASSFDVIL
jgi:hypothetical protein